MDHYTAVLLSADGTTSALDSDALGAAEAKQGTIGRLAEPLTEGPPQSGAAALETFSHGQRDYCPACLDDVHAATCPNLTRTGQG